MLILATATTDATNDVECMLCQMPLHSRLKIKTRVREKERVSKRKHTHKYTEIRDHCVTSIVSHCAVHLSHNCDGQTSHRLHNTVQCIHKVKRVHWSVNLYRRFVWIYWHSPQKTIAKTLTAVGEQSCSKLEMSTRCQISIILIYWLWQYILYYTCISFFPTPVYLTGGMLHEMLKDFSESFFVCEFEVFYILFTVALCVKALSL